MTSPQNEDFTLQLLYSNKKNGSIIKEIYTMEKNNLSIEKSSGEKASFQLSEEEFSNFILLLRKKNLLHSSEYSGSENAKSSEDYQLSTHIYGKDIHIRIQNYAEESKAESTVLDRRNAILEVRSFLKNRK
ncbi:MAG: hypothetical protein KDK45_01530 [Leptospiraceae bacterium]|nr:hypothetical protein [Leptospiraceae bacterium]